MNIVFETEYDKNMAKLIKTAFDSAAKYFSIPQKTEIILSFLTEDEIRAVNKATRNKDSVTDVLSFPYLTDIKNKKIAVKEHKTDINPLTNRLMLGEINICFERIKQQAEQFGHSIDRECAYIALHALLHILGYDHINPNDKKEMREKEEAILYPLGITRL